MSIFQRSDGRWVAKVKDQTRHPAKWIQRTFRTKEEADAFQDEAIQEERQSARLTVYEAVGLYLNDRQLSESTRQHYRWLVGGARENQPRAKQRVGYAECIAERYVDSLDRRDLNTVRDCAREGGASPAGINYWTGMLSAAFNYAVQEGLLAVNPWAKFRPLQASHGTRAGTLEQFQKIYPHLPAWMQWACRTALALCLRPGIVELFRLKWAAFDFAHGAVTVLMGKVGRMKTVFPPAHYLSEAWERFCADGQDKELYVCRNSRGGAVHEYREVLGQAIRKSGCGPFSLYALRHIAATQMIAAGADVAAVAANLGHSSPAITLSHYAQALPQAQKAASAALGAVWCGPALPKPEESGS